MQLSFIIHHYKLNRLTTSYIQITMATNNDNGGHTVESHSLSKFTSDGKFVKTVGGKGSGKTGQFEYHCSQLTSFFVTDSVTGYKCLTLI